jgi:hypothetical protein
MDDSYLGAGSVRRRADKAAISGKKLYASFKEGVFVKKAHKGLKITGDALAAVCEGKEVISYEERTDASISESNYKLETTRFPKWHRRVEKSVPSAKFRGQAPLY